MNNENLNVVHTAEDVQKGDISMENSTENAIDTEKELASKQAEYNELFSLSEENRNLDENQIMLGYAPYSEAERKDADDNLNKLQNEIEILKNKISNHKESTLNVVK